uniref:Uncharacterized protein n=1 Tax=Alexandrium catenella TaxID=2925 RepID=A0A7S1LHU5_ALECA
MMAGERQVDCASSHAVFHPCKSTTRWKTCLLQIGQEAFNGRTKASSGQAAYLLMQYAKLPGEASVSGGAALHSWVFLLGAVVVGLVAVASAVKVRRRQAYAPNGVPFGRLPPSRCNRSTPADEQKERCLLLE